MADLEQALALSEQADRELETFGTGEQAIFTATQANTKALLAVCERLDAWAKDYSYAGWAVAEKESE